MDVRRLSTPLLEKCHTILHKPSVYIRKTAYNAMRFIHFTLTWVQLDVWSYE